MKKVFLVAVLSLITSLLWAQGSFPPHADSVGTTAIHKDSSIVAAWVQNCTVTRGPQHIPNANSPLADVGTESSVYGPPDGDVLSLGDGGSAIIELIEPLANHPSYDFAIFENGLVDLSNGKIFLELAFVEVSSDGVNFYRFPNESLTPTDTQTLPFGYTEAHNIHNLAGKYRVNYGTPFDLDDMDTVSGLDIQAITHIKIIDVIGSIDSAYASYDSYGRIINDPFPTSFSSGGFDLDAVAVVDSSFTTGISGVQWDEVSIYPNPTSDWIHVNIYDYELAIYDIQGRKVHNDLNSPSDISITHLPKGIYVVEITRGNSRYFEKIMKL